jgi:hypothetical protein
MNNGLKQVNMHIVNLSSWSSQGSKTHDGFMLAYLLTRGIMFLIFKKKLPYDERNNTNLIIHMKMAHEHKLKNNKAHGVQRRENCPKSMNNPKSLKSMLSSSHVVAHSHFTA